MSWLDTKRRLTDDVIRTFSEPVTYTVKGGSPVDIETEFRARFKRVAFDRDGVPVESVKPRLLISYSLIPDTISVRPHKGDEFSAQDQDYKVVEVEDSGMGYWVCWAVEVD